MQIHTLKAKDVLNPFYLKKPILQEEFNSFVKALQDYKQGLETHQAQNEKSLVSNVLAPFLNTFGLNALSADKQKGNSEIDLSLNKEQKEVIIEAKKWGSKEFITPENANTKAMREAILYFLRERELGNTALKFIVITDFYQFYIFKAKSFENFFYKNKIIQSLYKNFNKDSLLSTTSGFYEELEKVLDSKGFEAHIFRDKLFNSGGGASNLLHALYINLKPKLNPHTDFSKLKEFFKIFHKDFLFKEFNPNDANTLNDAFYKELLYILGLKEQKISSALLITKSEESNTQGTLYKGISDKLKNVEFESILSLIILWLNRILFLKLIEAKLISFNTKDKEASLKFLSYEKIGSFKKLSYLFFEVLAKPYKHRQEHKDFQALPYLNSSLFSKKDIENVLDISALDDDLELNFFEHTQIKDKYCNKKQGKTKLLEYLFAFLDSFDFGSYGEENTLIKQKELINSSVLGAVFEKLNGYKEGSFYTPSFITNYMCKQSLEKIVLEKFNTAFKFEAKNLESLKLELREKRKGLKLEELSKFKEQCKALLVSIRICDPAVGSGHFLVSALVSMIKIYDELSLFTQDFYTKSNQDELQVLSLNGEFIEYKKPKSLENNKAQLIQEELFNLKKSIIENNLFGVDINPNSCEITKLRLWIELLKHSFYLDTQSAFENLQTLPNIDINIKCGNSLISRFNLDSKISKTLEKQVEIYKKYVKWYKEPKEYELEIDIEKAKLKNQGQEFKSTKEMLEYQITTIKRTFTNNLKDPKTQEALTKKINEHFRNYGYFPEEESHWGEILLGLVGITRPLGLELSKDEAAFESYGKIRNLKAKLDYNESGEVYKDAFEWRFAFPEVLDSNGDFLGFDLIIGNPPYGVDLSKDQREMYKKTYSTSQTNTAALFMYLSDRILKAGGINTLIVPKSLNYVAKWADVREFIKPDMYLLADCGKAWDYVLLEMVIFARAKGITIEHYCTHFLIDGTKQEINIESRRKNPFKLSTYESEWIKIDKSLIGLFGFFPSNLSKEELRLGVKVRKNIKTNLLEMAQCFRGGSFQKDVKANSIGETYKVLGGKEIQRCFIKGIKGFVSKQTKIGSKANIQNNSVLLQRIIAHIENPTPHIKFMATIANNKNYKIVNTIFQIICNDNVPNKYILGIFHSKFINWYCYRFCFAKAIRSMDFSNEIADKIPVPKITKTNQKIVNEIIALVDEILDSKAKDPTLNTHELESQIDSLVYQLYNLTNKEIELIENK